MFLGDVLLEMIVVLLSALIAEAVRTSILSKRQNDKPLFSKAKHQYLSVLTFYDNNFTNKNKTAKLYIRS